MNSTIGVIGCGWLGLPLAAILVKNGATVLGTTTSTEKIEVLKNRGIQPFLISLNEAGFTGDINGFLAPLAILIVNIPPKLRRGQGENYVTKIKHLLKAIESTDIKHIVFASSTSVYGDVAGMVTETTVPMPNTPSGIQLLECEKLLTKTTHFKTSIIRFGGLIGPKRHPITMLAGRTDLSNGNHPINLIQLADCIQLISEIITNNWYGTFNAVYPLHPSKKEYYETAAKNNQLVAPTYLNTTKEGKLISSEKLIKKGFSFKTKI